MKNTLLTLAALLILAGAGCAVEPTTTFRNQRFVLTDAQRRDSNAYPDPTKVDTMAYYDGYSQQTLRNTPVGTTPAFTDNAPQYYNQAPARPVYTTPMGGYSRYNGYGSYGYNNYGGYSGYGYAGYYNGYGYSGGRRNRW